MLEWTGPDEGGVYRAYDDLAMYFIARDGSGRFRVGFFPAPGPECPWDDSIETLEAAIASAARCPAHVRETMERLWSEATPWPSNALRLRREV